MALHFQMTPEAQAQLRSQAQRNKLSSLLACTIFMLVGGSILYFTAIFISKAMPPAFDVYQAAADNTPPSKRPKVKDLSSKSAPSSSVAPSVIVSAAASPIAMAEVEIPSVNMPIGTGMEINIGLGTSIGDGLGDSGGGMGSGDAGGSALEGTFYDFKQTAKGAKTGITYNAERNQLNSADDFGKVAKILGEFFASSWNPNVLKKYYQAPSKLYASNFYLPDCKATCAPYAFKVSEKVQPSGWCVVYRGKVRAPKTGRFRFVGGGDDLVAVNFNKKTVLESGWVIPSLYNKNDKTPQQHWNRFGSIGTNKNYQAKIATYLGHKDYTLFKQDGIGAWNENLGGLVGGNIIEVKAGHVYPIEILVSEVPGGSFGYLLMIQDLGNSPVIDGKTRLDIFRTNFKLPDREEIDQMLIKSNSKKGDTPQLKYNEDSLIWTAVP